MFSNMGKGCVPKIIDEAETVPAATTIAEKSCEGAPVVLQLSSASSWAEVATSIAGVAVTILALFAAAGAIIGFQELKNIVRGVAREVAGEEAKKVSEKYHEEQKKKTTEEELK